MKVFIEKHSQGYCLVIAEGYNKGFTIGHGLPHHRSTLYFKNKKAARQWAADNKLVMEES